MSSAFESIGENILFTVLFGLVMYLFLRSTRGQAEILDGKHILRVPKFVYYFGATCMFLGSYVIVQIMLDEEENAILLISIFFSLFVLGGYLLILFYMNHRVEFDDKNISVTNLFKRKRSLKWSEIEEVKFSLSANSHKLRTRDAKASISIYLVGVNEFLNMMESQTRFKRQDKKMKW